MILFSSSIGGKRDRALEGNCLFWGPLCTPKNNPSAPGELRLGPGVHAAPELPQRTAAVGEADFFSHLPKWWVVTKWAQKSPVISMESLWHLGDLIRDSISVG